MAAAADEHFTVALREAGRVTEHLLDSLLPDLPGDPLRQAMRYALLGGGKRLRPFLVHQSAALFGVAPFSAQRVGASLEALHCYSLVHDDLPAMDDDDLRRGRPTLHKAFDEATAILAGDGLLTFAFEILAQPETHQDAKVRIALVSALAQASGAGGMVGGQMLDLMAEKKPFANFGDIASMQGKKTGALIRYACISGAVLAGQDSRSLDAYGTCAGLAFQIADDVLDVESDAAALGKATQKDRSKGKVTFVDLLGLDGAKREADRLCQEAIAALSPYGHKAQLLKDAARFIVSRRS